MKNPFQGCIALDPAPNNKKVTTGATFQKNTYSTNISPIEEKSQLLIFSNSQISSMNKCSEDQKRTQKMHFFSTFSSTTAVKMVMFLIVSQSDVNINYFPYFFKSSSSSNFFIIWSTIKCDTPLQRIFRGRFKEILKSGCCLLKILSK